MPHAMSREQRIHTKNPCGDNLAQGGRLLELDERQPGCFAFEEELGGAWEGHGETRLLINESRSTL
jgi:hypothetical protein